MRLRIGVGDAVGRRGLQGAALYPTFEWDLQGGEAAASVRGRAVVDAVADLLLDVLEAQGSVGVEPFDAVVEAEAIGLLDLEAEVAFAFSVAATAAAVLGAEVEVVGVGSLEGAWHVLVDVVASSSIEAAMEASVEATAEGATAAELEADVDVLGAASSSTELDVEGVEASAHAAMEPVLDAVADATVAGALEPHLEADATVTAQGDVAADFDVSVGEAATSGQVAADLGAVAEATAAASATAALAAAATVQGAGSVGDAVFEYVHAFSRIADKDTWVEVTCPGSPTAHGGEAVLVVARTGSGGARDAGGKAYIAFDLSSYPAASSVEVVKLKVKNVAQSGSGMRFHFGILSDADEGWSESAMTCGTAPSHSDELNLSASTNTTSPVTYDLSSAAAILNRVRDRLGVGVFTLVIFENQSGSSFRDLASREAADANFRPQLEVEFSTA